MTISTTSNTTTQQGNGSNTNWNYTFLIPSADDLVVTLTTIADGTTEVLDPSVYSVTGINDPNGGTVTYPLIGSPLSTAFNITIQRILPLTQEVDLVNQSAFYPDVVEGEFDYLTMLVQQMQEQIDRALAFPVGASTVSITTLMTDILNAAANATAAAASAAAAAASAASIEALLPLDTANIHDSAITTAKLATAAVTLIKMATEVMGQVTILNGTIVESHAANAVTFSIKTLAGNDPSASDPVRFLLRDVTAGNGDYTVIDRTTAMSFTISAGSTMGFSSGVAGRLWLMVFNDSGTLRLAAVNCLVGTNIFPLQGFGIASATAEGGAGGADTAGVIYCGAAVTSKAYGVIGYASYETGLATAGNWAASPTRMQLYGFGVPLPGSTIQTQRTVSSAVATGATILPTDDTIPQITEGNEYMTQAITPSSAANILEVEVQLHLATNQVNFNMTAALFRDATANALAVGNQWIGVSGQIAQVNVKYTAIAGDIAATTFRARGGGPFANTTTFNGAAAARLFGGVINSYISVKELMA